MSIVDGPTWEAENPQVAIDKTLAERGSRYGDFKDHARIAQNIKRGMACKGYDNLPDMHRQALEVIADKIARILNGDPNYADNWHDIQGYAKLVEDRLVAAAPVPPTLTERVLGARHPDYCAHGVHLDAECGVCYELNRKRQI